MKKNYIKTKLFLLVFGCASYIGTAQTTLYSEDFEGTDMDNYQLYNASSSTVAFIGSTTDYIKRANYNTVSLGNQPTGTNVFDSGGKQILIEDHDGGGANLFGIHHIDTDAIDITGASQMSFSFKLAVTGNNYGTLNRYETTDFLRVEYAIDGGGYNTLFYGSGVSATGSQFFKDVNLNGANGTGDDVALNEEVLTHTALIPDTGNSMIIRISFFSNAAQEEYIFDDLLVVADNVLSIDKLDLSEKISIHPNPSKGIFTIQGLQDVNAQTAEIYNITGQKVASINLATDQATKQVTLNNLANGMYIMKITTPQGTAVKKLVIK